jgi:hypothetical protein
MADLSAQNAALLFGLCRTLSMLAATLVKQGALDRERTILDFERFLGELGQSDADRTTRVWTNYLLEMLRNDPDRPPPAPVLKFPPAD